MDDENIELTSKTSIEIENIPKDKLIRLGEIIGNILVEIGIKFDFGSCADGFSNKICGLVFEVEEEDDE